jgi:CheY-like chemotaxis protein
MTPPQEAFWPPVDRVLVADDERAMRMTLSYALEKEGFDVVSVGDGLAAREVMLSDSPPQVLLLDWNMPGATGPELCRWIRTQTALSSCYIVLVTARDTTGDLIEGLGAGADDFVRKPVRPLEVVARVRAGRRLAQLQANLAARLVELETALGEVKQLRGLIPICSHCHSIRSGSEHWLQLESYIERHSEATFSHSICDACMEKHYPSGCARDAAEEPGAEEAA